MEYSPILGPVVALVAWTLVMLVWMAIAAPNGLRQARDQLEHHSARLTWREPRREGA